MNSPAKPEDDQRARSPIRIVIITDQHRVARAVADDFGFSSSRWVFINDAERLRGLHRDTPVLLGPRWRELPERVRFEIQAVLLYGGFKNVWNYSAIR